MGLPPAPRWLWLQKMNRLPGEATCGCLPIIIFAGVSRKMR